MRQLQVRLFLCVFLLTLCRPGFLAAEETASPQPPTAVESGHIEPGIAEPETPAAVQAASTEGPIEPTYGIKPPVPLLPDPTDPTLSAELAEQNLVNLFQGAAEFRVPLALPRGVNGHTPTVQLRYSSHQARQNGPVGFGWQLEPGVIRRMVRGPAVSLYEENEFYRVRSAKHIFLLSD